MLVFSLENQATFHRMDLWLRDFLLQQKTIRSQIPPSNDVPIFAAFNFSLFRY
jgi:hypothetical protein